MYDLNDIFECSFEFKFNQKRCDILICAITPKGHIIAALVIYEDAGNNDQAKLIFVDENHENIFSEFFEVKKLKEESILYQDDPLGSSTIFAIEQVSL